MLPLAMPALTRVLTDGFGATLGELLVVGIAADVVGVSGELDLHVGIALHDLHDGVEDGLGIRTQGRLVELEGHAAQLQDLGQRAAVAVHAGVGRGAGALVLGIDDAVAVGILKAGGAHHLDHLGLGLGRNRDFRLVPEGDFKACVDAYVLGAVGAGAGLEVVVDVAAFHADVHALAQIRGQEAKASVAVEGEGVGIIREDVVVDAAGADQHERREADAIAEGEHQVDASAGTVEVRALVVAGLDDVAEHGELPAQARARVHAVESLEGATVVAFEVAAVVGEHVGVLEQIAAHEPKIGSAGRALGRSRLLHRGIGSRGCVRSHARIRWRCAGIRRSRVCGCRTVLRQRCAGKANKGNHRRNKKLPLHGCLLVDEPIERLFIKDSVTARMGRDA